MLLSPQTEAAIAAVAHLPSRQPPSNPPLCAAECGPDKLTHQDHARLEAAVSAARRRWPKSVLAEFLEREIRTFKDVSFRYDNTGLMGRLVDELLKPERDAA